MADNWAGSNNPFMDYLEYEPQAAYYSSPAGWTGTSAFAPQSQGQQRYYQNQFQAVYNEFLGSLGSQVRAGGAPTERWSDYLEKIPWAARYAALTPDQAGRGTRRFSPGTRQIYF